MLDVTARRPAVTLTDRELAVVELLCSGLTPKEIAGRLALSVWTVKSHVVSARRRTGSRTNVQLGHYLGRARLVRGGIPQTSNPVEEVAEGA